MTKTQGHHQPVERMQKLTITIAGPAGAGAFPRAALKVFLGASPEGRAERRWKEDQANGEAFTPSRVLDGVHERDRRDRERTVSRLVRAKDAVLVGTTAMGIGETARV